MSTNYNARSDAQVTRQSTSTASNCTDSTPVAFSPKEEFSGNSRATRIDTAEVLPEIGRSEQEQVEVTTRDDGILNQSFDQAILPQSEHTTLRTGRDDLVLRRMLLKTLSVPIATPMETTLFEFDPFIEYYNLALTTNSAMSTFRDAYFDLKITITVVSLPPVGGLLRFFFNRFDMVVLKHSGMFNFDHYDLDLSNKSYLDFTLTMELPYRVMSFQPTPFTGHGVGKLVCFNPLDVTAPATISSPIRLQVYAEPCNFRGYNIRQSSMTRLQTMLQPFELQTVTNALSRVSVSNTYSPKDFASHWGIVTQVEIPAEVTPGHELLRLECHPHVAIHTPLSELATQYSFFRGALKFRLTVNLNKFQNVEFGVGFVPRSAAYANDALDAFAFQDFTFDQTHVHEVELEYAAGSQWLPCGSPSMRVESMFGELVVIMRSPVISAAPPAKQPYLMVEIAAGSSFEVAYPRDATIPLYRPPIVQALNNEYPVSSISPSTNLYHDATLPTFLFAQKLSTTPHLVPVTPAMCPTGVLDLLVRSHAGWSGSLDFALEFTTEGHCEIHYDPLGMNDVLAQREVKCNPRTGFTMFAHSTVNRMFHFRVPFVCIYDYVLNKDSVHSRNLMHSISTGSLIFHGSGAIKVFVKAGPDFKVHMYNSFRYYRDAVATFDDAPPQGFDQSVADSTAGIARPQAGWADRLGIDSSELNDTVSEAKALIASLRPVVHMGTNVMEIVLNILEGPGKAFTAAFNLANRGLTGLIDVVTNIHQFISCFLEIVTPSYLWNFLKNAVAESFSPQELLILYTSAVVGGAAALGVNNPSFIILTLISFGLATPPLVSLMTSLSSTLLSEVADPAVKATTKNEAGGIGASLVTILATVFGAFIPAGKTTLMSKMGSFAKDFSAIFTGAKALDEIYGAIVSCLVSSPVIASALGVDFAGVSLLLSVDLEGYVDEVRGLLLSDYYNRGITHEMIVAQERLTKIRREIETKLPKIDKTNFFFNTTLRKVMDEQEKMHKHVRAHRGHARERFCPFVIMIHGQTRVGKSVLAASLQEHFCNLMDWDVENDVYTRQNNDKYFSGLGHQKILYIDDAHTNINADGADSDMATIMAFATNAPWAPPMASIEDKGRCVTSLIGMFVTNTPGVPAYAGIRNTDAYLARRNLLIGMRWKEGHTQHESDFSHAEFVLHDPLDPAGRRCLNRNFEPVPDTSPDVVRYSYDELWRLCATLFIDHMLRQRKLRHERRNRVVSPAPVDDELLTAVKKMCDNFDDLDAIPITTFFNTARNQALSPVETLGAHHDKYAAIYELFGGRILSAINDIFYVPAFDTFTWRGRDERNRELYHALLEVSSGEPLDDHYQMVEDLASVIVEENEDARAEYLASVPDEMRIFVGRRVDRIIKIREAMSGFATTGSRTFWGELVTLTGMIPRWIKILMLAGATGAFIYHMLRRDEKPDRLAAPPVVYPPQYAKEMLPAMSLPVKKKPEPAPTQYQKELLPAVSMPIKKRLPEMQYQKELLPAFALPVKKQPPEVMSESVTLPLPDRAVVISPFDPHEKATPLDANLTHVKTESAAELDEAQKQISDKVCRVQRSGTVQNGYLLDDSTVLVNRHFLTTTYPPLLESEVFDFCYEVAGAEVTQCYLEKRIITREHLWPVGKEDFCLIRLPKPLPFVRKGWGHIVTQRELEHLYPTTGLLISRTQKFKSVIHSLYPVKRLLRANKETFINLDSSMNVCNPSSIFVDGFTYRAVTDDGSCGAPLVLEGSGGKVCGLHGAAFVTPDRSGEGLAHLVYKEMLESALIAREELFYWQKDPQYLNPSTIYNGRMDSLSALLTRVQSGPVIDVEKFGLEVIGVTEMNVATRGSMRTSYTESPLSRFFPIEPFRVPAVLSPNDPRLPFPYDPRADILGKYTRPIKPLDPARLMRVVEHLALQMEPLYHPHKPTGFLSFQESIDGIPGAPFYDPINMHSSPGIPFSFHGHHRKSSLFTVESYYSNSAPRYTPVTPLLEERFDHIVNHAMNGNMVEVLFQEFMKDELLKRSKVFEKPATRGIANPPIDLLLAERAAFLPFIALCMYNRGSLDCQVGINPMSGSEWSALVNRLQGNSMLVFDADYSAFDSTIHGETLDAFALLANKVMGGTFQEQLARKTLIRYVYDRVSQVTNVQVKIDQGMASGMPMTAVGNSIVNMFYIRYAWLKLAEEHAPDLACLREFDNHVKAIVYGDDNMVSVKNEVAHWYNLRSIAKALSEYGILMTDGAKNTGDKVKPFGDWKDMRFLKRAFVLDERTGLYLAPLEMKTILDRIRYVKSKCWVVDLDMRCQMSLYDAVMHGEEAFSALQFFINDCYKELDLAPYTFEYAFERGRWESAGRLAKNQSLVFTTDSGKTGLKQFTVDRNVQPTQQNNKWVLPLPDPHSISISTPTSNTWYCFDKGVSTPTTSQGGKPPGNHGNANPLHPGGNTHPPAAVPAHVNPKDFKPITDAVHHDAEIIQANVNACCNKLEEKFTKTEETLNKEFFNLSKQMLGMENHLQVELKKCQNHTPIAQAPTYCSRCRAEMPNHGKGKAVDIGPSIELSAWRIIPVAESEIKGKAWSSIRFEHECILDYGFQKTEFKQPFDITVPGSALIHFEGDGKIESHFCDGGTAQFKKTHATPRVFVCKHMPERKYAVAYVYPLREELSAATFKNYEPVAPFTAASYPQAAHKSPAAQAGIPYSKPLLDRVSVLAGPYIHVKHGPLDVLSFLKYGKWQATFTFKNGKEQRAEVVLQFVNPMKISFPATPDKGKFSDHVCPAVAVCLKDDKFKVACYCGMLKSVTDVSACVLEVV